MNYQDVLDFHVKFKINHVDPVPHVPAKDVVDFRSAFLQEELNEFTWACTMGDVAEAVDALIDLVYVAYGTAILMGVTPECWQACWNEVQRANMSKERRESEEADPRSKRGHHLDVVKPDDWEPPDLETIIKRYARGDNDVRPAQRRDPKRLEGQASSSTRLEDSRNDD